MLASIFFPAGISSCSACSIWGFACGWLWAWLQIQWWWQPQTAALGGFLQEAQAFGTSWTPMEMFFWIGWDLQILCFQGSNLRVLGFDIVGMHFNFWDYMVPLVVFNPPRTVLVCLVALANNCLFVLEQPAQSLAGRWHRFEWLINHVAWAPWLDFVRVRIWVY